MSKNKYLLDLPDPEEEDELEEEQQWDGEEEDDDLLDPPYPIFLLGGV